MLYGNFRDQDIQCERVKMLEKGHRPEMKIAGLRPGIDIL